MTRRVGQYKNWAMGVVMAIDELKPSKWELTIKTMELCYNNDGEEYVSKYTLIIVVKKEVFIERLRTLKPGDPVLVGYYVQSYRSPRGLSYTVLSLRALEPLMLDEMSAVSQSIWKSKKDPFMVFGDKLDMENYFQTIKQENNERNK